jgi:hypothetical protein
LPVYRAATGDYQVDGCETDRYLAFVVSQLKPAINLQLAAGLAVPVSGFSRRCQVKSAPPLNRENVTTKPPASSAPWELAIQPSP